MRRRTSYWRIEGLTGKIEGTGAKSCKVCRLLRRSFEALI